MDTIIMLELYVIRMLKLIVILFKKILYLEKLRLSLVIPVIN